jgi:hypothetical protein
VNFARVLESIASFLEERGHQYALIGGVASPRTGSHGQRSISTSSWMQLPGVERSQVKAYFDRHGLKERFDEIERAG